MKKETSTVSENNVNKLRKPQCAFEKIISPQCLMQDAFQQLYNKNALRNKILSEVLGKLYVHRIYKMNICWPLYIYKYHQKLYNNIIQNVTFTSF